MSIECGSEILHLTMSWYSHDYWNIRLHYRSDVLNVQRSFMS